MTFSSCADERRADASTWCVVPHSRSSTRTSVPTPTPERSSPLLGACQSVLSPSGTPSERSKAQKTDQWGGAPSCAMSPRPLTARQRMTKRARHGAAGAARRLGLRRVVPDEELEVLGRPVGGAPSRRRTKWLTPALVAHARFAVVLVSNIKGVGVLPCSRPRPWSGRRTSRSRARRAAPGRGTCDTATAASHPPRSRQHVGTRRASYAPAPCSPPAAWPRSQREWPPCRESPPRHARRRPRSTARGRCRRGTSGRGTYCAPCCACCHAAATCSCACCTCCCAACFASCCAAATCCSVRCCACCCSCCAW